MSRCIQLAKNGLGSTYPNPMVGAVVVYNDTIIGEGWHKKAGEPHAEVNAINSVRNKNLLKKATIYVSLEPCSHFGKTPPCANLIMASGIRKVVIGNLDPNPEVAGRGIKKLQEAGCEIVLGILEDQCYELNKRFFTFHIQKRPYIFLKWAQTANGFVAPLPASRKDTRPFWITNPYSRQLVHKMRSQEMSILVGTKTVLADNPSLTVREWAGKNPVRLVIDRETKLDPHLAIFDASAATLVFTEKNISSQDIKAGISFFNIDFSKNIAGQICDILYKNNIQSLIVEGGPKTIQTFVDSGLWDEAWVFIGANSFDEGIRAPEFKGSLISEKHIERDSLLIYKAFTDRTA